MVDRRPPHPYEELEEIIAQYRLTFTKSDRSEAVEWSRLLPMVGVYYSLLDGHGVIPPTQDEFVNRYVDLCRIEGIVRGTMSAIRYRAQRAYPSFVRQHHAELVLRSAFPWTLRSTIMDRIGVDILVISEHGDVLGIALSVDTEASRGWSASKAERNGSRKPPFDVLTIYCEPREKVVGEFWLHDPKRLLAAVGEYFLKTEAVYR